MKTDLPQTYLDAIHRPVHPCKMCDGLGYFIAGVDPCPACLGAGVLPDDTTQDQS